MIGGHRTSTARPVLAAYTPWLRVRDAAPRVSERTSLTLLSEFSGSGDSFQSLHLYVWRGLMRRVYVGRGFGEKRSHSVQPNACLERVSSFGYHIFCRHHEYMTAKSTTYAATLVRPALLHLQNDALI